MRIAILGSGAREHAIAWALGGHDLWSVPGNAGTAQIGTNVVDVNPMDADAVAAFAQSKEIDLVVVSPEGPLARGVVDRLALVGIPAFGPTQAAAQIETSKNFAIDLMRRASIPHPQSWAFSNPQAVRTFVGRYDKPVVVKADGLARGKGVWVCENYEGAVQAAALCADLYPGPIIVQERLSGKEVSVFVFTDGFTVSKPVAACDYKRLRDGNTGPNTGGMGSYAWPSFWTEELSTWVVEYVMRPAIRAMALRGTPYVGVLYAGLILTEQGPMVLEFNCRLGDPEAQVILPLFRGNNLAKVMLSCVRGMLSPEVVEWDRTQSAVGVVVASPGYGRLRLKGDRTDEEIEVCGLGDIVYGSNALVFHGATRLAPDGLRILAGAGRILTAVGLGESLPEARRRAYEKAAGMKFPHHVRQDIAQM